MTWDKPNEINSFPLIPGGVKNRFPDPTWWEVIVFIVIIVLILVAG